MFWEPRANRRCVCKRPSENSVIERLSLRRERLSHLALEVCAKALVKHSRYDGRADKLVICEGVRRESGLEGRGHMLDEGEVERATEVRVEQQLTPLCVP